MFSYLITNFRCICIAKLVAVVRMLVRCLTGVLLSMLTLRYAGPTNAHVGRFKLIVYVCVLMPVAVFGAAGCGFLITVHATGTVLASKTVAVR